MKGGIPVTNTDQGTKSYRISVDLTPAYRDEVARLRAVTGLGTADLFRHALNLMRIYVQAKSEGHEVRIVDTKAPETQTRIEFPIMLSAEQAG
jgi:hypothetical protein